LAPAKVGEQGFQMLLFAENQSIDKLAERQSPSMAVVT
jgi:hypothetical protein